VQGRGIVPEFWDYLYLHTGDILRVGRTGARLGRKSSTKGSLDVEDDLPGERLEMAASAKGYRGILTMPHGARAVPVVLPIQSDDLIEGGERPAFQPEDEKRKTAGKHELESGTILVEDSIFLTLADLTSEAWKNLEEEAQKTRREMDAIERPNLLGLCPVQKAHQLEIWVKVTVRGNTECYTEIEKVLAALIQLGTQLFDYLEPSLLKTLETRLMFDTIRIWNDDFTISGKADAHSLITRFTHQFETIEKLSAGKWESSFILPCSRAGLLDGVYQSEHINEMLGRVDLGILMPFIEGLEAWQSGDTTPDDWLKLLWKMESVFPTLNNLGWTAEKEGNDLMMDRQFHDNLLSAVLSDFIPYLLEGLEKEGRGVSGFLSHLEDLHLQQLGIQVRKGGVYRRGHRVVCDRIRRNTERSVTAWLELYDNKGNRLSREEIGNRADLTHSETELDYRNCAWMVIRIGHSQQPISADDFNRRLHLGYYCPGCNYEHDSWTPNPEIASPIGDVWTCDNCGHSDGRRMSTDEEWEQHQNPNPFEAFVTLPWFIRLDNERLDRKKEVGRSGVGILGEDSRQLVHVHFTETVSSSEGDSVAIIPLCVEAHKGLKPKMRGRKSFTTICFRAMFLTSLSEERGKNHREDVADPGSAWWVERPST
jgi:hypothetical protein